MDKPSKEVILAYFDEHKTKLIDTYNSNDFLNKIASAAKKIGVKACYEVLLLYYALLSEGMAASTKATICAALGYFILPIDIIPDLLGVVGFLDDAIVIAFVKSVIEDYITPDIRMQAKAALSSWFGDLSNCELG